MPHPDIFGTNNPTPDGTTVRDDIYVNDLAAVHPLALDALCGGAATTSYNCRYGRGLLTREVVPGAEIVTGHLCRFEARRPGDTPSLISAQSRIEPNLGRFPRMTTWKG